MREMYCCSYVQKNIYLRIKYLICNSVTEYSYTRGPSTDLEYEKYSVKDSF